MQGKLLICSQRFPPSCGGTPTVLGNIVSGLPANQIAILSMADASETRPTNETVQTFRHLRLPKPGWFTRKFDRYHFKSAGQLFRRFQLFSPHDQTQAVLIANPCSGFELAAWQLAQNYGCPYFIYFLDECLGFEKGLIRKFGAQAGQAAYRKFLDQAAGRFCINPFLRDHFSWRYPDLHFDDLPMPAPQQSVSDKQKKDINTLIAPWRKHKDQPVIGLTGQIHPSYNLEAIQLLIATLDAMGEASPLFVLATPDPLSRLADYGIHPKPNIRICSLGPDRCRAFQHSVDLLYLPVPLANLEKSFTQTSFPSKTLEYLATTTRILVHGSQKVPFLRWIKKSGMVDCSHADSVERIIPLLSSLQREAMTLPEQCKNREFFLRDRAPDIIAGHLWKRLGF